MVFVGRWLVTALTTGSLHAHNKLSSTWLTQHQTKKTEVFCRPAVSVSTEGGDEDDDDYYEPPSEFIVINDEEEEVSSLRGKSIKSAGEAQAIETAMREYPTGPVGQERRTTKRTSTADNSNTRKKPNLTMNVPNSSPQRNFSSRWPTPPLRPRAPTTKPDEGSSWLERNSQYDKGTSKSFREDFRGTRVFVQGIPPNTSWQTLKDHFRTAGTVVFASVSHNGETAIVQYETTDQAAMAIQIMRDHPLNGSNLYVRADVQETKSEQQQQQLGKNKRKDNPNLVFWQCASPDYMTVMDYDKIEAVEAILRSRDQARRRRNYDAADSMRQQLRYDYNVQLDDRSHLWWISTDDTEEGGQSGRPAPWEQIQTEHDNDVDAALVFTLLNKRDIARRKKDFATADALLEQAYAVPKREGVSLRIHDESRTWRLWLDELPRSDRRTTTRQNRDSGSTTAEAELRNDPDDSDAEDKQRAQCIALVEKYDPTKVSDVKKLLEKFPASSLLPRLRDRFV